MVRANVNFPFFVHQAPKKILPWINPLEAFEFGNDCVQLDFQTKRIRGNEDCLYLNVFVPANGFDDNSTDMPVIVVIVGESFQSGSAKFYGPDFLIEQNAIVVSTAPSPFCSIFS